MIVFLLPRADALSAPFVVRTADELSACSDVLDAWINNGTAPEAETFRKLFDQKAYGRVGLMGKKSLVSVVKTLDFSTSMELDAFRSAGGECSVDVRTPEKSKCSSYWSVFSILDSRKVVVARYGKIPPHVQPASVAVDEGKVDEGKDRDGPAPVAGKNEAETEGSPVVNKVQPIEPPLGQKFGFAEDLSFDVNVLVTDFYYNPVSELAFSKDWAGRTIFPNPPGEDDFNKLMKVAGWKIIPREMLFDPDNKVLAVFDTDSDAQSGAVFSSDAVRDGLVKGFEFSLSKDESAPLLSVSTRFDVHLFSQGLEPGVKEIGWADSRVKVDATTCDRCEAFFKGILSPPDMTVATPKSETPKGPSDILEFWLVLRVRHGSYIRFMVVPVHMKVGSGKLEVKTDLIQFAQFPFSDKF